MRKTTLSATVSSAKLHASKHFPKRAHLLASTALLAGMVMSGAALAQTWTGTTDTDWDTGTNWTGDAAPVAAGNAVLNTAAGNQPTLSTATPALTSTDISAGTLTISAAGNLISTSVTVGATGTISNSGTITGLLTTGGTVTSTGAFSSGLTVTDGTTNLTGTASVAGNVIVSGGVLTNHSGGAIGGNITISGTGEFINGGSGTPVPNISNAAILTIQDAGAFTGNRADLVGTINQSGGTITQSGTLNANSMTHTGGTFGTNTQVANLRLNTGAATYTMSGTAEIGRLGILQATNVTLQGGAIAGKVIGGTTATLTDGTETVLVNTGTTAVTNTGSIVAGTINVQAGGTLQTAGGALLGHSTDATDRTNLIVDGALEASGNEAVADLSGAGTIAMTGGILTVAGAGTTAFSGNISGTGGLTVNKSAGVLTLSGTNTHGGATTLAAGGLTLSGGAAIGNTSAVAVNGGTLTVSTSETIGALSGTGGGASIAAGQALTTSAAGTAARSFAGTVGGAGTFTKGGTDTLTLNGVVSVANVGVTGGTLALNNIGNTMSAISVGGGRLNIGASGTTNSVAIATGATATIGVTGSVTNASAITATGTTALTVNVGAADNATLSGAIATGMGSFTRSGTGTLNLTNGTSTYGTFNVNAGTTNVSAGAMGLAAVNGGSLTISGTATVGTATVNNGTLTLNAGAPTTITVGDGVAGPGTDRLVIGTALTGATTITTQGSVIEYLADSGAPINLNSNDTQLEVAAGPARTQSGVISQTGGARPLEKIGAGELILSAANTYTGETTVTAGTLNVTGSIGSASVVVEDTASLVVDGASLSDTAAVNLIASGNLTVNTAVETIGSLNATNAASTVVLNAGLIVGDATNTSVAGVISGAGGITKTGVGTLTLTGTNTYGGSTTISGGTVSINNSNALGAATGDLILNGGKLLATTTTALSKNNLRLTGESAIAASTNQTLSITSNNISLNDLPAPGATTTFGSSTETGIVQLTGGSLSSIGFFGDTSNVVIAGGTLRFGNQFTANGWLLGLVDNTQIDAIGTLDINGFVTGVRNLTGTGTVTNNGAGANILQVSQTTNFGGVIQDGVAATGLNVLGATTLTGGNTYTGSTLLSGGDLTLSGAGAIASTDVTINAGRTLTTQGGLATGTVLANNGSLVLTGTEEIGSLDGTGAVNLNGNTLTTGGLNSNTALSGVVSGAGSLIKIGTGTQTLSGNNTASNLTVQDGTLLLSGNNSGVGLITVGGGGVGEVGRLRLENNLAGGTLIRTQGSVISYADGVTMATPIQLNSNDTQLEVLAAAAATQSGVISDFNATPRPIEKIGAGTLTLSATNTYSGATTVSAGTLTLTGSIDSPTVTVNGTAALSLDNGDALLNTAAVVLNGSGAMALANANSETIGSLAGSATSSVNLNGNTLTVGNAGAATTTMAGAISGAGGITKTGASTLALTGTSNYTGRTRISGGTLSLNNGSALGAAAASIDLNGGTLLGTANATLAKNEIQLVTSSTIAAAGGTTLGLTPTTFRLTPAAASTLRFGTATQAGAVVVNASGVTSNANATVSIDAGTLRMGNAAAGSSLLELIGGTNVDAAGTLDMNGNNTRVNLLTGAGAVTNNNAAAATLQTSGSSSFGGNIQNGTGTTALTVLADTLTLTQANGYTGATTLSGGNLTLSGSGSLASTSVNLGSNMLSTDGAGLAATTAVTSAGGTLALFGNETIASYNGNGAISVTGLSNALTLNNGVSAVGAVISGTGGLTVTGSSDTSLTAANTYQGGTIISGGGHLTVSGAGTLGAATGSTMISGGILTINTDVTQFNVTQSGGVINGTNTLTATNQFNHISLIINSAVETPVFSMQGGEISSTGIVTASNRSELNGTSAINGTLDGAGTGAATVQTGTTTLGATGAITNMASVNVDGGAALTTGGAQQIADAAIVTVDGTLNLGGAETLAGLNGGATGVVNNGGNTLTLGTTGGSFDGEINGTGGLIVTGGTQTLTGMNGYTGATDITGGTLSIISNGTLASTDLETAAGATLSTEGNALQTTAAITNAGTLSLNGNEEVASVSGAGGIGLTNGNLTLNAGTSTISGVISGTNDLLIVGSSATTLSGANTFTGSTEVEGTLTVAGTGEIAGATDVSASGTMNNAGVVQEIRNAGTLTNSGTAGEVRNSGTMSNSGTTGAAINTGTGTNTGTIASLAQQSGSFANSGTISGNAAATGGTLNHSGTVGGNLTVAAGSTANVNAGTVSGTTTNNGGTINIDGGTFAGAVSNAVGTLTAAGTVSAAIENAATMTVTSPAALDLTGTIINTGTGLFTTSGTVATSGGLTNAGTVNAQGALNSAVANNAAFNVTGPLTATGQDFANAANLSIGANSYTGIGTLTNGPSATIDLSAGGTLGTTTLTNNGTVNANDATVWGGITNNMAFNAQRAALSGSLINISAGVFDLTGGTITGPVNNAGTFILTNGSVSGVFTNSGTVTALGNTSMGGFVGSGSGVVNMLTPSGGGVPTADRLTINGDVNGGIFAMDLNIGTDKAVDSGGNPINPTGGTSDQIAVTGNISGALHFDFINKAPAGVGPFLGDAVLVLDGMNASDTYSTTHSGLGAGGAVVYSLAKIGDDLKVVSETSAGIGGVAANASLVQSLIGTVVNRPTSPFVSGLATEEGCSRGGYLRGTYGVTTVSGSSNNSISTSSSSVRARYAGAQGGYDFGCNDGRFFDGWDGSFGAMVGYNTGKSDQDVVVGVSGGGTAVASITHSKFDQKYIGAYTAFAKDRITTDVQVRLEKTNFELNETVLPGFFGLGLNNAKFSTNSTNITGRFSYRMDLNDDGLNLVPTAGLSYTHTSGSTVNFTGGESLRLAAFDSIVGFVGGTLAKTKIAPEGNAGTTYFGSANYYHDFAGDRKSVFTDALGGTQNITTKNIGGFGELSMGVNYVRILENGAAGAKQLNANVRLDTRFGSNVKKSASLTAQVRLSF